LFHFVLLTALGVFLTGCERGVAPPQPSTASLDRPLASLIETSRQAVAAAPKSAEAWGRLGQVFHAAEFFADAQICYAKATELDMHSARWPHLLGLLQLQEKPDAAFASLARAVELTGNQPDAPRLRLAQALVERGRFDDAARHLDALLAAVPDHSGARLEKARVLFARGELDRAAEALQPCATNIFTRRPATLLLSQIRQRQGSVEMAAVLARSAAAQPRPFDWPDPWLREALSLRADRAKLEDQVNGLLMQQRLPQAEVALAKLLNTYPDDTEGLLLLGRLRYLERKCPEAEEAYRRHLTVQPSSLNGLIQLAIAILCQERWADAAAVLRQALALKPDFAQAHSNLGLALSRLGDRAGAITSYRDALRSNPGDVGAHLALADELQRAGQTGEAVQHIKRASELNPDDPRVKTLREQIEKR
jgi:tetratricopeptide (TPR) repeat protein